MPLTPRFSLSQTPSTVTVTVRVPHVRVSSRTIEAVVDGVDFSFYSPPYLLRLRFPRELIDDAETGRDARAVYDPDDEDGTVRVTAYKAVEGGSDWEDLDLLGMLVVGAAPRLTPR